MAFNATFYTFSKKANSTKTPGTGGASFSIVIKEPSSILNPTIVLRTSNPKAYNYCYISEFGRYYFVGDWISDHNLWSTELKVDTLASWKSGFLNTRQYVLRSGSEHDEYIIDDAYIMTKEISSEVVPVPLLPRDGFFTKASYIFAVSNNDTSVPKVNGIQYIVCDETQAKQFMYGILNGASNYWNTGSTEVTDDIVRSITNPLQYVGSAFVLPIQIQGGQGGYLESISTLKLGPWNVGTLNANCLKVNNVWGQAFSGQIYNETKTVTLSAHTQLLTEVIPDYGVYLNGEPFTVRYLYAGPFGMVKLDSNLLVDITESTQIDINVRCDFLGNAILTVKKHSSSVVNENPELVRAYANIAVPIPLTQTKNDVVGWLGSFAGAVGAASQLNVAGTIAGAANAISGIDSVLNKPEVKGFQGSMIQTYDPWFVQSEFRHVSGNGYLANYHEGRPLMQMKILNTLSGFTVCGRPFLSLECYKPEYDEIINFMTTGFYIEEE